MIIEVGERENIPVLTYPTLQTLLLTSALLPGVYSRQAFPSPEGFHSDIFRSHQPSEMKSPARKITTFSAGMARAGARAPRVKRCMHIFARPPAQRARSGPPLSRDPVADILGLSFAGLIMFLHHGSGSNANVHSKRQATLQEFGFGSVRKVLPSFEEHKKVRGAFQGTSAESSTPESVHMNVGVSKSQNM